MIRLWTIMVGGKVLQYLHVMYLGGTRKQKPASLERDGSSSSIGQDG